MTPSTSGLSRRNLLLSLAAAPVALAMPALLRATPARAEEPAPAGPIPGLLRHRIGAIEVLSLADGFGQVPTAMIIGLEPRSAVEAAALAYKPHDPTNVTISINAYLIRTGDRLIAVDTGAGGAMGPSLGAWQLSLEAAGIDPAGIDTLFLTHAHTDHVGGMSDSAGQRLLPNAGLVLAEAEWDFTHDEAVLASLPDQFKGNFLQARAQLAPYAADRDVLPMDRDTEIAPGVTAVPMPGHTPGHMGLRVESEGEQLLIWGDIVHAPAYQFSQPDWSVAFDADIATAISSRRKLLDMAATDRTMVAGMHLDFPALGFVERHAGAFRYVAAPPDFRV